MKLNALIITMLIGFQCFAQTEDEKPIPPLWKAPSKVLKLSPLHLYNFYPTIELSYEHRVKGKFTTQIEAGYVLDYSLNTNTKYQNKRGFKLKLEPRYYFAHSRTNRVNFYTSAEGYLNRINFDRESFETRCFDGSCSFQFRQRTSYEMRYREQGFSIKMGWVINLHRFLFDFNSGLTVRRIRYYGDRSNQRNDFLLFGNWFEPNETARTVISPNVGIRLGYRFE
jgi:hypothetical protein